LVAGDLLLPLERDLEALLFLEALRLLLLLLALLPRELFPAAPSCFFWATRAERRRVVVELSAVSLLLAPLADLDLFPVFLAPRFDR
jgi:hypothetical protein